MFRSQVTEEIRSNVQAALENEPNFMPSALAQKLGVSEGVVVAALPDAMRSFADADRFEDIWKEAQKWKKVTFFVHTPGVIIEYKGTLPEGSFGRGYFNLMDKANPLGGHLMISRLASICFLQKQLFGLESLSVQFFDAEGAQMFGIYAGREEKEIIPAVKTAWIAMKDRFCTE